MRAIVTRKQALRYRKSIHVRAGFIRRIPAPHPCGAGV